MGFEAGEGNSIAVAAWNLMGGLDWAAMDTMLEYYDINEPEIFICELVAIRDHMTRQAKNG